MSLKCPFCNEVFASWEIMSEHIRVKHKNKVKIARFEHPKRERSPLLKHSDQCDQ